MASLLESRGNLNIAQLHCVACDDAMKAIRGCGVPPKSSEVDGYSYKFDEIGGMSRGAGPSWKWEMCPRSYLKFASFGALNEGRRLVADLELRRLGFMEWDLNDRMKWEADVIVPMFSLAAVIEADRKPKPTAQQPM